MAPVPKSPAQFFSSYLPDRVTAAAQRLGVVLSSVGSIAFRLLEEDRGYSVRLSRGSLVCSPGIADDVLLQVTLTQSSFELLIVSVAERESEVVANSERHLLALRTLGIDRERADNVLQATGTAALEIRSPEHVERAWITPGSAAPDLEHPTCRILVDSRDFSDMQVGKVTPLELILGGKIQIEGNAQGLMIALGAILG